MADEELSRMIEELCNSKAEEFRLIGYEHVTGTRGLGLRKRKIQ